MKPLDGRKPLTKNNLMARISINTPTHSLIAKLLFLLIKKVLLLMIIVKVTIVMLKNKRYWRYWGRYETPSFDWTPRDIEILGMLPFF